MADYDFRPGGVLKLKPGVAEGGIVKRKKKKSKARPEVDDKTKERVGIEGFGATSGSASGQGRHGSPLSVNDDRKTDAERRFEQVQRRRLLAKVAKHADKTHKDRVNEFNAKLEALSEHHDIPKVGPG